MQMFLYTNSTVETTQRFGNKFHRSTGSHSSTKCKNGICTTTTITCVDGKCQKTVVEEKE